MRLSKAMAAGKLDLVRDGEFEVFSLLDSPTSKPTLVFAGDARFIKQFRPNVSCVICSPDLISKIPGHIGIAVAENPKLAFFKLHNSLSAYPPLARDRFATITGENCRIHKLACIAEENVVIGNNVLIEEFVSIKENTVIGDNVIIRAGSVIGGEGFYFIRNSEETVMPVSHFGGVLLEDDVEIQQSTGIDRAYFPWDNTVIGQGSKLDNLAQIGHACKIGRNAFICSFTGMGGNVKLGDNVWVGPGCVISNNLTIGDNTRLSLGSVVVRNVADNTAVTGNFAIEHSLFMKELKERFKMK
jgi:UDP-3-O-[3-hydroxymyristoyl] glucosamine N-acyltransferase